MRTMKDMMKPSMLRFLKSVRLQRGGGWKAARLGVLAVVVVVWVWVYFLSPPTHTPPHMTHDHWSSGSPNLQVAAPIREGGGRETGKDKIDTIQTWKRSNIRVEHKIHPIKVEEVEERIEKGGGGGRIMIEEEEEKSNKKVNKEEKKVEEEEEQEQETNPRYNRVRDGNVGLGKDLRDKQIFPNVFPKRRLILPGDTKLLEEEDEDDEEEEEVQEEEEGKWKGRNKEEVDNHAMEEEDDVVGIEDKNDKNNDDDFVEEDVGGEAMKRKRQRREKPRRRKIDNNNNINENNNKKNLQNTKHKNSVVDPQNDLKENGNQGQRSNKEGENDPSYPPHDLRDIDLVAVEEEMRQRRSKVKQVCARYGLGPHAPPGAPRKVKYPPTPAYETFYIDRDDRLAWCPVYKAASTSWLYGFLGLAGISESYVKNTKEQVSTLARRVWPTLSYDVAKEAVRTCVKAMVVRHPFERLVSAFRDKLEKVAGGEAHGTEHFYQKYGKKIVEKYRSKDEVEGNKGKGGTSDNQRNGDTKGWKKEEMGMNIDVRGGSSDIKEIHREMRGLKDGVREKREVWGKNKGGSKDTMVNQGNIGENNDAPPPPPLRYSHALDDTDTHHDPPPPPPPPPVRYKHILEDTPAPPPPHSPPILFPDELDDPHQPPQPPPQRYKHILVDDSPPQQPEPESTPKQGKEPTFTEFVKYLIDTDLTLYADDHWMPYHLSCTPCLVDFDVIAKFETLNRDQAFLLRKANLQGKLSLSWRHLTKGNRTKDVMKRYFADVPKKDLLSLFKKYRLDFEMFDYSVDEYLNYVKAD